jgi:hypothetical protein
MINMEPHGQPRDTFKYAWAGIPHVVPKVGIELELMITLISSWVVYGACQQDILLPGICGFILLLGAFINRKPDESVPIKSRAHIPSINLIGIALLFGWIWRSFLPDSTLLMAGAPRALKVMQTTLVILSLLIWFQRGYILRTYSLKLLSWMIVALSINVKFDSAATVAFRSFFGINIWFILIKPHLHSTVIPIKMPLRSWKFFLTTTYLTAFLLISGALFAGLVYTVKLGDQTFMQFIHDYLQPYRHPFFAMQSTLDLRGPGYSGRDIRPILEIEGADQQPLYLSTQVFEQYQNGTWREPDQVIKQPISNELDPSSTKIQMIMFDHLQGIIPSPDRIFAVKSRNHVFQEDENRIIHAPDPTVLKVSFRIDQDPQMAATLSEKRRQQLTDLSPTLRKQLRPYVEEIVGIESDPGKTAKILEVYFRKNFQYSLDIIFAANESGLLAMLKERKPAYCSYFATAMILMLRERGIPARLRVGFLVTEKINNTKQWLARVRDAHAWVEVLLPVDGLQAAYHWVRFDPTPAASRLTLLNSGRPLNHLADWICRLQGRIKSEILNLDTMGITIKILVLVLMVMILKNYKEILAGFSALNFFNHGPGTILKKGPHPYVHIYQTFEKLIGKTFFIKRCEAETMEQFFTKLRAGRIVSPETFAFFSSFLKQYQAVRFGQKAEHHLKEYLRAIEEKIKKRKA